MAESIKCRLTIRWRLTMVKAFLQLLSATRLVGLAVMQLARDLGGGEDDGLIGRARRMRRWSGRGRRGRGVQSGLEPRRGRLEGERGVLL